MDVHNLLDDMALSCSNILENGEACGSVKFCLLKSGKTECAHCGDKDEVQMVFNMDSIPKANNAIVGIMAATKDDFQTVIKVLVGMGIDTAKKSGLDGEAFLKSISEQDL